MIGMRRALRGSARLMGILLLCWVSTGSGRVGQMPIPPQDIIVALTPVRLAPAQQAAQTTGALTFLQGYALHAASEEFGGWSAMSVSQQGLRLISDAGAVLDLPFPKGQAVTARLRELPKGCGNHWNKTQHDAEATTRDPQTGRWWVTLERLNVICRVDAHGHVTSIARAAMSHWSTPLGAESMVRLADGRFLILAEGAPDPARTAMPLLLYDRDPVDPKAQLKRLSFAAPPGFRPADATQLPDGRILILLRGFEAPITWRTRLVVVSQDQLVAGAIVSGQEIARLEAPMLTDNFEAVAVTQEKRRTIIWLASDDNFWPLQQSYLLKFALED
ncbi:MAG: hypothetical protein RLZ59_1039 [Pseudomonadota bacterium]|jgi:hypothetical protein